MDQEPKEEGPASRYGNPFPNERNSQKQPPSGKAGDQDTSSESHCMKASHLKHVLTTFGLSVDDLKKLSQYPDDQLTPENMPVLLQAIRKSKLAPKVPALPSKSTEKETVSSADDSGPTVKKKVIDYGHKSKYGYNEGPVETNASPIATGESTRGVRTQQPASVPAAASGLISNPKNLAKELMQQVGSQASTPNLQASPRVNPAQKVPSAGLGVPSVPQAAMRPATPPIRSPAVNQSSFVPELMELLSRHGRSQPTPRADPPNRPCQATAGQKGFRKETEEPFKSPFGVVKASWLPDFSQTEKQKEKKLPTSSQMCDYYAVTPRIFPHTCSLCDEDCMDKKGWIQHQNTFLHNENCRQLLHQYPDWAPENPSSPKRHEGDRQERHESRQHSASPSPKRSRLSSSGHARHWTRSRSRSSGRHRTSRPRSRSPSWHSTSPCPKHSRCSSSGHFRHRTRSRSRSSERHRTSRPRSRSPKYPSSPRHRSRSPWHSLHSSRWSQNSSSKERRRHESWNSASPSPEHSRHSSCGHASHWTRSRSRSSERHRTSRPRSRSPRCLHSPRHRSRSQSRSPRQSLHSSRWSRSSSSRERRRWSRSRSSERHRTSRPRSRSPRLSPSPRHHSRSPRQSSHSSRLSQNSFSKERRCGSSTRSTEERHAKTPCSKKEKQSCSGPESQKKGHEDLERTREDTSHCQEETRDKLVPEGQSHVEPERSALASLTEKSVLQAMAQLQAQGAAGGILSQGRNSAQLAAKVTSTSAMSSDLISMIQQVATRVITAVLDSRGASTTRASTSVRDPNPQKVKSGISKAKAPSPQHGTAKGTKGPSPQHGTTKGSKGPSTQHGTAKGSKGPSTQDGTAKGSKGPSTQDGTAKGTKGPSTQDGTAKGSKGPSTQHGTAKGNKGPSTQHGTAKGNKGPSTQHGTAKNSKGPSPNQGTAKGTKSLSSQQDTAKSTKGPSPQQGTAKGTEGPSSQQDTAKGTKSPSPQQGTAKSTEAKHKSLESPCPKKGTSLCSQAKNKGVVSPSAQQGVAAGGKEETLSVVGQWPEPVIAPSDKAADGSGLGLSPHQGTAAGGKSESEQQAVAASCGLKEGAAGNGETESQPVADPVPSQGTSASGETENKCPEVPSSQQGIGANVEARQGETEPVLVPGSVCPGSGKAAVSSQPVNSKAETSSVASPSPQPGTSGPCKAENKDVEQELVVSIPLSLVCLPGEAAVSSQPVSIKAETSDVASPGPQPGMSESSKAENQDVEQKVVAGSVPPCPGEAAVSSQPVNSKAETSGVASPSPQPGTSGPCKAENKDVEQELVLENISPCPGEAAVSSQPVIIKAETSGVASPSSQPGMSGPCKAENKDVEQELVPGSLPPCPGEAAVSSQPVSIKAETSDVASPSHQSGTSGPCKAENKDVEQELVAGSLPPRPGEAAVRSQPVSIKAETSDVASPSPQPGTSGPCKAEKKDVEQELVLESVPPCPGEAAVNFQPVSIKAETSDVASPSPQPGTSRPCKGENKDVELVLGSVPPCLGEAAVNSQPVSIKAETSDVDNPSPQPGTSGPCKAEKKDVEQELVAGSVPPSSGEAAVSSQPVNIKAETSGVASPSPQPGMSGPCKAEKKDVEQELVSGSVPPCPGNPKQAPKRRVWICGQSVVVSAEKQASGTGAGSQLGLEEGVILEWHGQEDLTWTGLVPLLRSLVAQGQAPDVLVIHLGERGLEENRGAQLTCTIRKELALMKELFPRVRILWSNLLLRRRGSGKAGSRTVNRVRTAVNLEVGPFVATLGGGVIEHQAILHTDPDLYTDGDNLSCRGLDLFLEDVKNGILGHLHS